MHAEQLTDMKRYTICCNYRSIDQRYAIASLATQSIGGTPVQNVPRFCHILHSLHHVDNQNIKDVFAPPAHPYIAIFKLEHPFDHK